MKHNTEELYRIDNGTERITVATKEYLDKHAIPHPELCREREALRRAGVTYASPMLYYVNNNKPVKVLDVDGIKLIYLYGEKTWFDTEEERDEYRTARNTEFSKSAERNKILKELNTILSGMETQSLEILLAKLS